jgi:diamine N-acetyltransferase
MKISLRKVTLENLDDLVELQLLDHQKAYLASNAYSIAEAGLNPALRAHAVYGDERVIGFALYCTADADAPDAGTYWIWRLMVDARLQGRGYGRQALELVLGEICSDATTRSIHICYKPDNAAAQRFYASLGFEELGIEDETGEMDARVRPQDIRWSDVSAQTQPAHRIAA